jgi:DeoR/GlpR family transcriptional regulator of sugar metabolism
VLAAQRQARILKEIERRGGVRVSELTGLLDVSDMTIRRDLEVLAGQGLLDKVRGGATPARAASTDEPGFDAKRLRQQDEKEAIARAALAYVLPGTAVGVSAGTTTWTLAHTLRNVPDLTIVTNSIQVAQVFHAVATRGQHVVLTGGVRTPSDALVGPVTVSALRQLHLDVLFLGVHGMDLKGGFTTPNLLEADADRAFVEAARRLVVLADHTKWGVLGLSTIARLDEAHALVTDDGLSHEATRALREQVNEVVLAEVGAHGPEMARPAGL